MAEDQTQKLHAACDECRTRKLKCSGDIPRCSRCEKECIQCIYSPQKQMGRPRKRRREDAGPSSEHTPDLVPDSSNSSLSGANLGNFGTVSPPTHFSESIGISDFPAYDNLANSFVLQHDDPTLINADTQGQALDLDSDFGANIDPSLWDAHPTGVDPARSAGPHVSITQNQHEEAPCTCLSIMYLTLTDLQTMKSFSFPAVIPTLRHAMNTASSLIHCQRCPNEPFNAVQNVLTLSSILCAVATRFHKVLDEVNKETGRLQQTGEKKLYRIGDRDPQLAHLHTGSAGCPMGFNIELEASDWRKIALKALKTEVVGGGSNPAPLTALLDQFERRQRKWHESPEHYEERARMFGAHTMGHHGEESNCVRMINQVRRMIAAMEWE
ncbi:hypothetical protein CC78DRAFT_614459 [Lojkania enalia]|uniref:Zn(2)-C6 fungal-type domain-containing protein n=1 Tax=Lojkania enalia TaxID=147567 RepID=A0A9P4KE96_9PLEO|nr:hypothetical protein CC78DRAFT_614459 [Didymosphaeria enalia]